MHLAPLYAILDVDLTRARGLSEREVFEAWLGAGVSLVQLRGKGLATAELLEIADALTARARAAGAILVVNDRADVARMAGAAGVHVGQSDLTPTDARAVVGPRAIVGVSTHNADEMERAVAAPVTYVAMGPVFATTSKARPDPVVGLEGIRRARARAAAAGLPLVAIGGITLASARSVLEAGATSVAVISDLLTNDPAARAREFLTVLRL